jgi:SAM-dependent methyltransferase
MGVVVEEPEAAFTRLVDTFDWCPGPRETPCGEGSFLKANEPVVRALQEWFTSYGIKSVVDVGCGDFHWMSGVDFTGMEYDGFDVVKKFVDALSCARGRQNIRFHHADAFKMKLPKADLYICKDVINHYTEPEGLALMERIRAASRHFAAITFPGNRGPNVPKWKYRYIDFDAPPFSLGAPLASVPANESRRPQRVFSIWRLP